MTKGLKGLFYINEKRDRYFIQVMDRASVSKNKLSLMLRTICPVTASIGPISSWIGLEISYIQSALSTCPAKCQSEEPFSILLEAIREFRTKMYSELIVISPCMLSQRIIVVGLCIYPILYVYMYIHVYLSARFLSNHGCGRYQTWISGYVKWGLSTAGC